MNTAKTVEAILNKEDKAVDHIISQNKTLALKINELTDRMKEIEDEKSEIEHDLDSVTKSKNILQGYSKNFHEMNKKERALKKEHENLYKVYMYVYYIVFTNAIMFYSMLVSIDNEMYRYIFVAIYLGILVLFTCKLNTYRSNKLEHIKKINQELAEVYKATDLVNDLMDNL